MTAAKRGSGPEARTRTIAEARAYASAAQVRPRSLTNRLAARNGEHATARNAWHAHCDARRGDSRSRWRRGVRRRFRGCCAPRSIEMSRTPAAPGPPAPPSRGHTCGAVFWVARGSRAAARAAAARRTASGGASAARAGRRLTPAPPRRATASGPRRPHARWSRAAGPRRRDRRTSRATRTLLSRAGLGVAKRRRERRSLHEAPRAGALPFWLARDGAGRGLRAGGFANLGLTPRRSRGAGSSWRLVRAPFLMPHARTAAAFGAKLHASGAFADAKDGGDARDEMPWYGSTARAIRSPLERGRAPAARAPMPALRFATEP